MRIGELEPEGEARPARSLEGRGARHRLVEQIETVANGLGRLRCAQQRERRERSVGFSFGCLFQREDRSLGVAGRGEQLASEKARLGEGHRLEQRGESCFGAITGHAIDVGKPSREIGVARRSFEQSDVRVARYLEIAAGERGIRGLGEPRQLELADGVRCEHRR